MTPTPEQFAKLPAWARETIKTLQRERDEAVKTLNQFCDGDTPSVFRYDVYASTGEERGPSPKRRYVQTGRMEVVYAGVVLSISARPSNQHGPGIRLQWSADNDRDEIAMIPEHHQGVVLKAKADMR